MISADSFMLAMSIHFQSYQLLKWFADAVGIGFIPATHTHAYPPLNCSAINFSTEPHFSTTDTAAG